MQTIQSRTFLLIIYETQRKRNKKKTFGLFKYE